jgi:putative membrane protein
MEGVDDKRLPGREETAMMGYGWGMGVAGWVFMGLFWIVVIGGVVWAIVSLLPGSQSGGRGRTETAQEILDRRFALGELDVEQYRQVREELRSTHAARR